MTKTRLKVLKYWLTNNKNNVGFNELIKFFFDSSYRKKSKKMISKLEVEDQYLKYYLKGYEKPIFFPRGFNIKSMEMVIVESFYKINWHYYEIEQTRVTNNDIVIDCGAAEGIFSFIIANRAKYIYAIEPLKDFTKSMALTFQDRNNINIVEYAISDHEYNAYISDRDISSIINDEQRGAEVKVTTLDKLFYEKNVPVSYIKIDLEGFDFLAIKGAAKLIEKNKPKIAVTTYHNINHANQIKEFLLSINPNYKILTKGIYHESGSPIMLHAWV